MCRYEAEHASALADMNTKNENTVAGLRAAVAEAEKISQVTATLVSRNH
jgi:hypothetical protein